MIAFGGLDIERTDIMAQKQQRKVTEPSNTHSSRTHRIEGKTGEVTGRTTGGQHHGRGKRQNLSG